MEFELAYYDIAVHALATTWQGFLQEEFYYLKTVY